MRALKVSYSDVGEGGVPVNCEKKTIFPNTFKWNYKNANVKNIHTYIIHTLS